MGGGECKELHIDGGERTGSQEGVGRRGAYRSVKRLLGSASGRLRCLEEWRGSIQEQRERIRGESEKKFKSVKGEE